MNNDKKIEEYRKKIEDKRSQLGKRPKVNLETNGLIKLPSTTININTLSTERACFDVATSLAQIQLGMNQANEWLDTSFDIMPQGESLSDYIKDIKQKIAIIRWDSEKRKLNEMDAQLEILLSNDAKVTNSINDIAKNLGI